MHPIRTLHTSLATLALAARAVATVTLAAAAQSSAPPDPTGAVVVTGEVVSADFVTEGTSTVSADGVNEIRGWSNTAVWEASDPRLSGHVTFVMNHDEFPGPDGVGTESGSRRVVNDGGSWSSTSTSVAGRGLPTIDVIVLTGEGGYAGLSAYLVLDYEAGGFQGAIFPGSMPEVPAKS